MAQSPDPVRVFDRRAVRRHRDRAAAALGEHDFLFREVAARLVDRLGDIRRGFPLALDLGSHGGTLGRALADNQKIGTLLECDLSPALAARAASPLAFAADEEFLPVAAGSLDAILSCLSLHWVNDLPGALVQMRRALKPDGLLLAALPGGGTLAELRRVLIEVETEREGGAGPRVSPFVDVRDAGDLLQRAGFALPVVDSDTITVSYGDALALMRDLRGMGEANGMVSRRKSFSRRETLFAAAARYAELYGDTDGRIPASFQIITLTAWAPDAGQPRALRPGSAEARLADALEAKETSAGEAADPKQG